MISQNEQQIEISGPLGRLEAILRRETLSADAGSKSPLLVICHPHPQHGGSMQNKVVTTLARTASDMGWNSLRFNYRGIGASEGEYGEFSGECDDLRAVIEHVVEYVAPGTIHLAGFSFGSGVASTVVEEYPQILSLTLVAPPVEKYDFQIQKNQFACPVFIVQGSNDDLVDYQAVERWAAEISPTPELLMLLEADHFFHRRLVELREQLKVRWKKVLGV